MAASLRAQGLPEWVIATEAQRGFGELWKRSVSGEKEYVACMAGRVTADTVFVTRTRLLDVVQTDSLSADGQPSIDECAAPDWIGTVHSHVRSTDDPSPAPRFSPGDRTVMSLWSQRWKQKGAFCVVYSEQSAHCEVYPPFR